MSILKTATAAKVARIAAVAGVVAASLISLTSVPAHAATAATVSPSTGDAAGGTVVTIKGRGFQDAAGSDVLLSVTFQVAACTTDATTGTDATMFNVVSATQAVAVTPALAANSYYACLHDGTTATETLLGQGTFTTGTAPGPTTLSGASSNVLGAPTTGRVTVTLSGTDFTSSCKATVDGLTAKTTYVNTTTLTIVLPAHAAQTGLKVLVTGEYGSGLSTDTITYYPALKLSTAYGLGTVDTVVSVTGSGFSSYTFGAPGTAANQKDVLFIPAGTTLTPNTTTIASLKACTNVIVVSDKLLTCKAPALGTGAYSVMIVQGDATDGTKYLSSTTTISRTATYTVAAF